MLRRSFLATLPLLVTVPARAQIGVFGSVASAPDPFLFVEDGANPGNQNTTGKTLYTGSLAGACVLIIAGQSNVCNSLPTPYTPSNPTVYNLNIYNGASYNDADPQLGCSGPGANFAGRLADGLINASLFSKVLLVPIGIDGTAVAQWTSQANFGSRIIAAIHRLSARGLAPTAILWGQGETDNILATSQSAYAASLTSVIALSRSSAGYNGPWFVAEQTWDAGTVSAAVQAAQTGIVNHGSGIWAGPNADSLGAGDRVGDNTHFNDTGSAAYAALWLTALEAFGAPF